MTYRNLTDAEIAILTSHGCRSEHWQWVEVGPGFDPEFISNTVFSSHVKLGAFHKEIAFEGGLIRHTGISDAVLHHVIVGDDVYIHGVHQYIANYIIGSDAVLIDVGVVYADDGATFGQGEDVQVVTKSGKAAVPLCPDLSLQTAYQMAFRPETGEAAELRERIRQNAFADHPGWGIIGDGSRIIGTTKIHNVQVGEYAYIEGVLRLQQTTVQSDREHPTLIGYGVTIGHSVISTGCKIADGTSLSHCFVGRDCRMGKQFSAEHSLFFDQCLCLKGEASGAFVGPHMEIGNRHTVLQHGYFGGPLKADLETAAESAEISDFEGIAGPMEIPEPLVHQTDNIDNQAVTEEWTIEIDDMTEEEPDLTAQTSEQTPVSEDPAPKPDPAPKSGPEPKPEPKPKPEPVPNPVPVAEPEPAPKPVPESKPDPVADKMPKAVMVQVSRPEQRSLFDPEVMEECRTVPTATLADTYQQTSPKLNEHLASGDVVLAQKMQRRPLPHLQGNIGLNDRFLYTRELFHSRPHDYQRALEKLDACNDLASARAYVEEELGWNMEQPAAKKFMLLLERRFADE